MSSGSYMREPYMREPALTSAEGTCYRQLVLANVQILLHEDDRWLTGLSTFNCWTHYDRSLC